MKQIVIDIFKKTHHPCFLYDKDNASSETDDNIQFINSNPLSSDNLLMEIRGKLISYSTYILKIISRQRRNASKNE